MLLPCSTYDRLSEVDPVDIVDNKKLGHVLDVARQVQKKRDNNRSQSIPSGDEPSRRRHVLSINKPQRSLNEEDLLGENTRRLMLIQKVSFSSFSNESETKGNAAAEKDTVFYGNRKRLPQRGTWSGKSVTILHTVI